MDEFKHRIYRDPFFEKCLQNIEKYLVGDGRTEWTGDGTVSLRDREKRAEQWARALAAEETWATELNQDRRTVLDLLYAVCNRCWKENKITQEEIVSSFQKNVHRIVINCLVMDRANSHFQLFNNVYNTRGKHFYAEEHAELMHKTGVIPESYQGGHTMNKRYLWLFRVPGLGLEDLERWFKPSLSPLIHCSEEILKKAKENGIVIYEDMQDIKVMSPTERDALIVLQSNPLVWEGLDNCIHPVDSLDFEDEIKFIKESAEQARGIGKEVVVYCEPATVENLASALASGCSALHISGHGHPSYMAVEDCGKLRQLPTDKLHSFVAAGNRAGMQKLKLVVVATCHSNLVAKAFLAAGVPHVVCCPQNATMDDAAAIYFARSFYKTLVTGAKLSTAFELAREVVGNLVVNGDLEKTKFLLAPNKDVPDDYHDVKIFFTDPGQHVPLALSTAIVTKVPPPPQHFLGRQIQMYEVMQHLQRFRLVQVTGPKGIGKTSFTKAVCTYIAHRIKNYEHVIWLGREQYEYRDSVATKLRRLLCGLQSESFFCSDEQAEAEIIKSLNGKKVLLAIDARGFGSDDSILRLKGFLGRLVQLISGARVLVVTVSEISFQVPYSETVELPPLRAEAACFLFATFCKWVDSGRAFASVRTRKDLEELLVTSPRLEVVYDLIGGGVPAKIEQIAANMSQQEYAELLRITAIGRRLDHY